MDQSRFIGMSHPPGSAGVRLGGMFRLPGVEVRIVREDFRPVSKNDEINARFIEVVACIIRMAFFHIFCSSVLL